MLYIFIPKNEGKKLIVIFQTVVFVIFVSIKKKQKE